MTTEDFIIELFCRIDDAMKDIDKHIQANLYPSEIVTLGLLFALKGIGNRAFYRWLSRDYKALFPKLPERTRLFRLFVTHQDWTNLFLVEPSLLSAIDSYGIDWLYRPSPLRRVRSGKTMQYPFLKGLDLSQQFFQEAVRPILDAHFPGLAYSAALLGAGSDVLGFDTPQSMDHDWGMRLLLFLSEDDHAARREAIDRALRSDLPREFLGYPVDMALRYASSPDRIRDEDSEHRHCVQILTLRGFFQSILHVDPFVEPRPSEWLTFTDQHLRSLTAGRVFHDGLDELERIRIRLQYYPNEIWLYMLAAQWTRISQEEHFMGRCAQAGDELGSRLVAARLVKDIMRLGFLMEKQYAPYIKWFGTAFARLECAGAMLPLLQSVLEAGSWQERETYLSAAYEIAAGMHNRLGITPPLKAQVAPFFNRPFQVIDGESFAQALRLAITDPQVLALPEHLGSVDQFVDSTDALNFPERFRVFYEYTPLFPLH